MASHGRKGSSQGLKSPTRPRSNSSRAAPPDSEPAKPSAKRNHTIQNDGSSSSFKNLAEEPERPDAFETSQEPEHDDVTEHSRDSIDLDELPIELVTLTDSFIESLSAKVHSTPPNIEKLSQLFQDFYTLASSHINTHIAALVMRQNRESSPAPSTSSIASAAIRLRSKAASIGSKDKPKAEPEPEQQQMITAAELADKKKARRALEAKKGLMEEAVERRLCEAVYDKIYRHRSTQDEAQDDKLRSKTAALALVGIGPKDLGIDLGGSDDTDVAARDEKIKETLSAARKDLEAMHESHYPLGKINHLKAAHKSIVDTLAHFQPSASADEIMPMLIYTLITLSPESLHVISDLNFMLNFRWEPKLTGEAAYCLTNLEATISFLQTVDLATLRADEHPSGPPKALDSIKAETFPPAYASASASTTAEASTETVTASKPVASPSGLTAASVLRNRRLSDLVNTPAQAFGAASDAVFSTADQGLKTISHSLGESYGFLLGKLRERQQGPQESINVPRTLDDARKLVSTPPPDDEDNGTASGSSSMISPEDADRLKNNQRDDRVLTLIGGKREPSVDSTRSARSASSAKKVAFAGESTPPPAAPTMLDQARNLSTSFNPMARLPSMNMIRGFGRNFAGAAATPTKEAPESKDGGDLSAVSHLTLMAASSKLLISINVGVPRACCRAPSERDPENCTAKQALHGDPDSWRASAWRSA